MSNHLLVEEIDIFQVTQLVNFIFIVNQMVVSILECEEFSTMLGGVNGSFQSLNNIFSSHLLFFVLIGSFHLLMGSLRMGVLGLGLLLRSALSLAAAAAATTTLSC